MKKVRVIRQFNDKLHNCLRDVGAEITESDERAIVLINRGFAVLVEDVIQKEVPVEKAVKDIKKEKAVKEKAVKIIDNLKKASKKNAKK